MSDQLNRLKQSQQSRREMLAQWRSTRTTELALPSGMTVWVKDVSMTDLVLTGKLPDTVVDFADAANKSGSSDVDLKMLAKNAGGFSELLNVLVQLCVVEPPIAEHADDDHLGLDEINSDDKMFIFNWANREVDQMRPFREGENEPVATVQPLDWIRQAPE